MSRITPELIEQKSYIDGDWITLKETGKWLTDPNTGEVRQAKRGTESSDVERALSAADALHESQELESISFEQRAKLLFQVADSLDQQIEKIALQDSINTGVPIKTTRIIAGTLGDRVRSAAHDALQLGEQIELNGVDRPVLLLRKPLGPAFIVAPWNAPTFTVVGKVAAAMAAGCPVLLKPSENAPSGNQIFAGILVDALEQHSYPKAAFQLIQGSSSVGSIITSDPRISALSFTGGVNAGRKVAQEIASNLGVMQMELGSNNPAIIMADADVNATAQSIVAGMTRLNGQWCEAPGKLLVHKSLFDDFVEAMKEELSKLTIGDALDDSTEVGPIAFEAQLNSLNASVERLISLGGEFISTSRMPDLGGWYMAPGMIIGCSPDQATEELFGPLVTVHAIDNIDEAVAYANGPGTGLVAYVFGADQDRALSIASRIRAGEVRINGTFMSDLAEGSKQTFWGTSGIGGHGPQYGVRFYLGDRVIGVDDPTLAV